MPEGDRSKFNSLHSRDVKGDPEPDPPCSALNPCSGTLVEPVTNCSRRPLLSSLNASTACQNHRTTLLSLVQCFSRVFDFQSARSIFPRPPMISWTRRGQRVTDGQNERKMSNTKTNSPVYLKFFVIKRFEQMLRDELAEALLEGQKLGFDPTHEPPVHIKSDEDKGQRRKPSQSMLLHRVSPPVFVGFFSPRSQTVFSSLLFSW